MLQLLKHFTRYPFPFLLLKTAPMPAYEETSRTGDSHMPVFKASCSVGDIKEEGEGGTKKEAKKRAAEKVYR